MQEWLKGFRRGVAALGSGAFYLNLGSASRRKPFPPTQDGYREDALFLYCRLCNVGDYLNTEQRSVMTAKKKDEATVPDVREDGRMLRTDLATVQKERLGVAREFSGPLSPPEMLERYEQISSDILIEMVRKEQALREKALDATIAENRREQGLIAKGLYLATAIIVLGIAAGCYCAFCGREWAAVAAFGVAGAVGWMKTGGAPTSDKSERK